MDNTEYHGISDKIDYIISYIMTTIFVVVFVVYFLLFQTFWLTYLIQDYRRSIRFATRIESQGILSVKDVVIVKNLKFNAKRDKVFIILLLAEALTIVCYVVGYSYHLIDYVSPNLDLTGLPFNSTCLNPALKYKIWVDEIRYPIVGLFLSLARGTFFICLGIWDYLLKIIANTYVTYSWQFKRNNISLIYVIIISFIFVVIGTIPYTNVLSHFLLLFGLIIYMRIVSKHMSFFSKKALVWGEQDMLYNVSRRFIQKHRIYKQRFILFSNMYFYGASIVLMMELMVGIESAVELFLYYGKCIFPVLYGFSYQPSISEEQLPQFHLALVIISCLEKSFVTFGVIVLLVPQLLFTFLFCINAVLEQRKKRLLTFRFRGNADSEIRAKLI